MTLLEKAGPRCEKNSKGHALRTLSLHPALGPSDFMGLQCLTGVLS